GPRSSRLAMRTSQLGQARLAARPHENENSRVRPAQRVGPCRPNTPPEVVGECGSFDPLRALVARAENRTPMPRQPAYNTLTRSWRCALTMGVLTIAQVHQATSLYSIRIA